MESLKKSYIFPQKWAIAQTEFNNEFLGQDEFCDRCAAVCRAFLFRRLLQFYKGASMQLGGGHTWQLLQLESGPAVAGARVHATKASRDQEDLRPARSAIKILFLKWRQNIH
jgi:hypothetical protein